VRVRHEAGELSPIAWNQAELERTRAAANLRTATHAAWLALRRYEVALSAY
jgi:hypothetical protein